MEHVHVLSGRSGMNLNHEITPAKNPNSDEKDLCGTPQLHPASEYVGCLVGHDAVEDSVRTV